MNEAITPAMIVIAEESGVYKETAIRSMSFAPRSDVALEATVFAITARSGIGRNIPTADLI